MAYWTRRAQLEREKLNRLSEKAYQEQLESLYRLQLSQLQKELDSYLQKYADSQGLTTAEAKKRADQFDVKAFEEKAKRYVREKDFSQQANKELKDYNFSMQVNRQELLIANLQLELVALAEGEYQLTENYLQDGYQQEIARGQLLGQTVPSPKTVDRLMNTAIKANFQGATWSHRLWKRQDALRAMVQTEVTRALIRGDNGLVIARKLRKTFDVSASQAKRLAVTEHARMQTLAQKDIMTANGFEYFSLYPESTACDNCRAIGKETANHPIPLKDMTIGESAAPIHPNCHCAIVEVYVEEDNEPQEIDVPDVAPYESIKKEWLNHSGTARVSDRTYWRQGKETYPVDGKNVVLDYSAKEKEVAEFLAGTFKRHVEMVPRVNNPEKIHTPDYLIDGLKFDLKEITGHGKSVLDNNCKKAKVQAENIIFDISETSLSVEQVMKQLASVYNSGRRGLNISVLKKENEIVDILQNKKRK